MSDTAHGFPLALLFQVARNLERGIVSGRDSGALIDDLCALFRADALTIGHDRGPQRRYRSTTDPSWQAAYTRVAHLDPSTQFLKTQPLGTPFFAHSVADTTPMLALHDAFRRAGFGDNLVVRLPFQGDARGILVLYRSAQRPAFDDDDRNLLRVVYPHLAQAFTKRRTSRALHADPNEATEDVLQRLPCVLEISASGVVRTSLAAKRYLQARSLFSAKGDRARLERVLLASLASQGPVARGPTYLPGSLPVEFFRAKSGGYWAIVGEAPVAPLFEPSPDVDTRPPSILETLLSKRQLAVVRLAAAGLSTPHIAQALSIGAETVKTHLRTSYERLGVRSRAELLRWVEDESSDPPPPAPDDTNPSF